MELKVRVLNINLGYNQTIMKKCRRLWEYSAFVEQINTELATGIGYKSQAEVIGMILSEYNEKEVMEFLQQEAWDKGLAKGRALP